MFGKKKESADLAQVKLKALEWLTFELEQIPKKNSFNYFRGMLDLAMFLGLISSEAYQAFNKAALEQGTKNDCPF